MQTRQPSISAPPCTWRRWARTAPPTRFAVLGLSLLICTDWLIGLRNAGSRRSSWNRPASTGSRFLNCSTSAALRYFWSMHLTPSMSPVARRTSDSRHLLKDRQSEPDHERAPPVTVEDFAPG